jgi:hypothetical protein
VRRDEHYRRRRHLRIYMNMFLSEDEDRGAAH